MPDIAASVEPSANVAAYTRSVLMPARRAAIGSWKVARICAINIIAQVKAACGGDLDRVVRCVEVGGFVNCTDDFTNQPEVVNGASDLMVEVFGEAGRHARFAVGTNALPRNVPVEVKAVFEIR